jgi:hypothetical protein
MSESDPDEVEHEEHLSFFGLMPSVFSTTISKDDDTYTGYGFSEEEANKKAGDAYRDGKKDNE